jgi:hypothetical protein
MIELDMNLKISRLTLLSLIIATGSVFAPGSGQVVGGQALPSPSPSPSQDVLNSFVKKQAEYMRTEQQKYRESMIAKMWPVKPYTTFHKELGNTFYDELLGVLSDDKIDPQLAEYYRNQLIDAAVVVHCCATKTRIEGTAEDTTQALRKAISILSPFVTETLKDASQAVRLRYDYLPQDTKQRFACAVLESLRKVFDVSVPDDPSSLWKYNGKYGIEAGNDEGFRCLLPLICERNCSMCRLSCFNLYLDHQKKDSTSTLEIISLDDSGRASLNPKLNIPDGAGRLQRAIEEYNKLDSSKLLSIVKHLGPKRDQKLAPHALALQDPNVAAVVVSLGLQASNAYAYVTFNSDAFSNSFGGSGSSNSFGGSRLSSAGRSSTSSGGWKFNIDDQGFQRALMAVAFGLGVYLICLGIVKAGELANQSAIGSPNDLGNILRVLEAQRVLQAQS